MEKIVKYLKQNNITFTLFSDGRMYVTTEQEISMFELEELIEMCNKLKMLLTVNQNKLIIETMLKQKS